MRYNSWQFTHVCLGDLSRYLGEFTDAMKYYTLASILHPNDGKSYLNLSLCHRQLLNSSAHSSQAVIESVYYWMRSQCAKTPVASSQQNVMVDMPLLPYVVEIRRAIDISVIRMESVQGQWRRFNDDLSIDILKFGAAPETWLLAYIHQILSSESGGVDIVIIQRIIVMCMSALTKSTSSNRGHCHLSLLLICLHHLCANANNGRNKKTTCVWLIIYTMKHLSQSIVIDDNCELSRSLFIQLLAWLCLNTAVVDDTVFTDQTGEIPLRNAFASIIHLISSKAVSSRPPSQKQLNAKVPEISGPPLMCEWECRGFVPLRDLYGNSKLFDPIPNNSSSSRCMLNSFYDEGDGEKAALVCSEEDFVRRLSDFTVFISAQCPKWFVMTKSRSSSETENDRTGKVKPAIFIVDTNMLIHNLELVKSLYNEKNAALIMIYVPLVVVNELMGLSISKPAAFESLQFVNQCLGEVKKNDGIPFRVITNTGALITTLDDFVEEWNVDYHLDNLGRSANNNNNNSNSSSSHKVGNDLKRVLKADDVIVSITKRLSEDEGHGKVVLLTEDVNMRLRARGLSIQTMSGRELRRRVL